MRQLEKTLPGPCKTTCLYDVDSEYRIRWVNPFWSEFAEANQADHLHEGRIRGTCLWDHITDRSTRNLYRMLIDRVFSTGAPSTFEYRCDAPDRRRFMRMEISPVSPDLCRLSSTILREEDRPFMELLDAEKPRGEDLVCICSWCKKVHAQDRWVEVEEAIGDLELFSRTTLPGLTHTICPPCEKTLFEQFELEASA